MVWNSHIRLLRINLGVFLWPKGPWTTFQKLKWDHGWKSLQILFQQIYMDTFTTIDVKVPISSLEADCYDEKIGKQTKFFQTF